MTRLFSTPGPRVFGLPPGADLPAALASGVRARLADAPPEALARVEIALNTRRTLRAVSEAFETAGDAVFLPRLSTLDRFGAGAADLPPPIERLSRRLTLTRLVEARLRANPDLGPLAAAGPLADALAGLLDETQREGVPLSSLDGAAAEDQAEYWRRTIAFLEVIGAEWPKILSAGGRADPEARRRADATALIAGWAAAPPARPIIAAGSTGSTRTTRDLLVAIAGLPQGALLLPGFDFALDDAGWEGVTADHPQFGFREILERLDLAPRDVIPWDDAVGATMSPRARLLSEALRPAPATDRWRAALPKLTAEAAASCGGLSLIEAPGPAAEAEAIAIEMRAALERPEGRVALVTPDRSLARRVTAALGRWDVEPDDSSGRPLPLTPPGVFLSMLAAALCRPFDQVALLALLKHPLTAAGEARSAHLQGVSRLERRGLRQRDVAQRLTSLAAVLGWSARARDDDEAEPLVDDALRAALAHLDPWPDAPRPLAELIADHRARAEALAGPALADKAAGRAAVEALDRFAAAAADYGDAAPAAYPALLQAALEDAGDVREEAWRPHPRLKIWGPLEARSQSAETMILGGLNEGVWPPAPAVDPWLSRPMRARIGLAPPERRIGLSAHDFLQAAAAPKVVLSRAVKAGGAPTTPARWLSRLTTLLGGVDGGAPLGEMRARGAARLAEAAALAAPPGETRPASRPAPRPPRQARPRRLSVTEIETLIRDPYAIYARRVLKLAPLDEPGAPPDHRTRGDVIHQVVERFAAATMAREPGPDWPALFDEISAEVVRASVATPVQALTWRARLQRARDWFVDEESKRRAKGAPVGLEAAGDLVFDTAAGRFTLHGRADRVDRLTSGEFVIYDYKAGGTPSEKQRAIFHKQLPLLAAIAERGGLGDMAPAPVAALAYLSLSGDKDGGKETDVDLEPDALERLTGLIEAFENEARPYLPRAYPEQMSYASDYEHLSRFGEWEDRPSGPPPGSERDG